MATESITLNPLTRIEGHLAIHTDSEPTTIDDKAVHRVTEARCEGEMFRGLEVILRGRDPLDAQQITQRICGVCPISHGIASIRAQEMAYGITPNHNGRLLQNLIFAANYMQSHVLHFYHLAALDFVDITAVLKYTGDDHTLKTVKAWVEQAVTRGDVFAAAPFLPRYEVDYVKDTDRNVRLLSHYIQALDIRRTAHEMAAVFGARLPHSTSLIPGGCTQKPTMERVLSYRARLEEIQSFIENVYVPDLLEVAKEFPEYLEIGRGCGNFLSFGVFEMNNKGDKFIGPGTVIDGQWSKLDPSGIAEYVGHSRFKSATGKHPYEGETTADPHRNGAYSWLKAPRYNGHAMEVGPLARVIVNYMAPGDSWIKREVDAFIKPLNLPVDKLFSVLGRHVARGLEAVWVARQASQWLDEIDLDASASEEFTIPAKGQGYGLTEAPRGALGHWLTLKDHKIDNYQCIVPTTWNCSPKDDNGLAGPVEQALVGAVVADKTQPIEIGRIVRSFDPCIACAVH